MIKGKSLSQLAAELERQSSAKQDFLVDTRELQVSHHAEQSFELVIPQQPAHVITDHAHGQLAGYTEIPKRYYDRMRVEAPHLLVENIHHWLHDEDKAARRMVRTLDGKARAFLSDRYRRIDNDEIFQAAGEALVESGAQVEVVSTDVTDRKLYIQAKFPKMEGEVKVGDPVQGGLIITNSEIGSGALEVRPMIYRLVCTNGMVRGSSLDEGRLRKQHVGRRVEAGEDFSVYSDETLKADDHALMLKIRDSILALTNPDLFLQLMEQMRRSAEAPAVANPVKAVEVLSKSFAFRESERNALLENLIRERDYTQWGMVNAVTAIANEHESYDRAIELEEMGGQVLDLGATAWSQIAEAE